MNRRQALIGGETLEADFARAGGEDRAGHEARATSELLWQIWPPNTKRKARSERCPSPRAAGADKTNAGGSVKCLAGIR
jgi:hypothetical protein